MVWLFSIIEFNLNSIKLELSCKQNLNSPFPLDSSGFRVRCWISRLCKICPELQQVPACRFVLLREDSLEGKLVLPEQHEDLVDVAASGERREQVQSGVLADFL